MMKKGIIAKALSGFYYIRCDDQLICCKGRGKFRKEKITPLVGDVVKFEELSEGTGIVREIMPRKNEFVRPMIANVDQMIIIASGAIPVTDIFLLDRMIAMAEIVECEPIVCINKCDLNRADVLYDTYKKTGITTFRVSAKTGEGIDLLRNVLQGKISVFTGNSGVGKSSILKAINPEFDILTGEVSDKLGRGRHTTRHVELFDIGQDALAADTPGFSSFDTDNVYLNIKENVQYAFREFKPYLGQCRYNDCAHIKESGCPVLDAVERGEIAASRHESYIKLYQRAKEIKPY